jgi:hypothetical protein
MVEYLANLREELKNINKTDSSEKKLNFIKNVKQSYFRARNTVIKLDQSLYLIHLIDSILNVSAMMLWIYMTAIGMNNEIVNSVSKALIFTTIICLIKTITSCLIHGMVYEENEKLFLCLEEFDVSDDCMNEKIFRELLYFKSQNSESKFGFTIAGVMPFRKFTFLSVSQEFEFEI